MPTNSITLDKLIDTKTIATTRLRDCALSFNRADETLRRGEEKKMLQGNVTTISVVGRCIGLFVVDFDQLNWNSSERYETRIRSAFSGFKGEWGYLMHHVSHFNFSFLPWNDPIDFAFFSCTIEANLELK